MLRVFPIKKNKVLACVSIGRRYDDNQKYIMEELHKLCPDLDIVWVKDPKYDYELPSWMRSVRWRSLRYFYEYVTAKIWTNNCTEPDYYVKRKGQLYVETWHGGLGIKRVASDIIGKGAKLRKQTIFFKNASDMADVYISNSDHLSVIYRRGFHYHGPIWKCGYPKNDMLVQNNPEEGIRARRELGIPLHHKVLLYAPTWRSRFAQNQHIEMEVYIQNYIDVRDIARAVRCAIEKEANGIYNIASDKSYSNKEVAELCIKLFNSCSKISYRGVDKEEDSRWIVSTEKAKKELGFKAFYSLEDTLKEIGKNFK